jgi:lysophospholipase L1-like esterase
MPFIPPEQVILGDVWADRDPLCTGTVRPMKILVGARSAISSGSGSVADWAKAAKTAGYDAVCFTETYEDLKQDQWDAYVAECRRCTDGTVALLPGFDVATDLGDRFLLVGSWSLIRPHLLTADRKKLFWTGHMLLGMGDVLPVIARPQWLATARGDQGSLPPDIYSHFAGVAVATYKDGKQVDDGFFAYKWHVDNASLPQPVAVHEVDAPAKLADAARTGLQSYVNSDTPEHALHYFRSPMGNAGGNPSRYYVSSGPLVDAYGIDNWTSPQWKMHLLAHDAVPVTEITVSDQRRVYRRWTFETPPRPQPSSRTGGSPAYRESRPTEEGSSSVATSVPVVRADVRSASGTSTDSVSVVWSGDLGAQHWFITELRDAQGGRCILPPVRTLPPYHYIRCLDRQNFFGLRYDWLTYTGGRMTSGKGACLEVPGVTLPASPLSKAQMRYTGNRLTVLDWVIDSMVAPGGTCWDPATKSYQPGGRRPGADNTPLYHEAPIPDYAGRVRHIVLRNRASRNIGGSAVHYEAEVEARLKKNLTVKGDVWPLLGSTTPKGTYTFAAADGKIVTGSLTNGGFIDLPAGGRINNLVALSPLRANAAGQLGPAARNGAPARSGTVYRIAFTPLAPDALGWNGDEGFELKLKQGTMTRTAGSVFLTAKDHGVAGTIREIPVPGWTNAPHAFLRGAGLTLRLQGGNPRWAAGLWMPDGTLDAFSFLDGVLMGTLVTQPEGSFYFGNFITAADPELNLAFASAWTTNGGIIEVNNPTDKAIKATVRTAAAIRDRPAIKATLTVPAGTTRYVVSDGGKTEVSDILLPPCLQGRRLLLFYGDSLTDGSSYPDFVVHSLNAAFPGAGFAVENSAKCGDNTRDLLRRFDADVAGKKPDVLSICIGANDAVQKLPVDEYKTNLLTLVQKAKALGIQPVLMLSSPRAQADQDAILLTYLKAMREVATECKLPLADAYGRFEAWQAAGKTVLGGDGLHHGPDGFPAMARAFLDGIGLKEVPLVTQVTPWPGALTNWEVSAPVAVTATNRESVFKLENANGWQPFHADEAIKRLGWADQPFVQRGGVLPLAVAPAQQGGQRVAFARTTYTANRAEKAELQVGGGIPLYVYCNGERVWSQPGAHGFHPDADRVQVALRKGPNEFIVCTGYMAYLNIRPPTR